MPVSVGHIVEALSQLGGEAHLNEITERVREIAPEPHPASIYQIIRARLQERCAEAESYKGVENLFESVYGVEARRGVWRLRTDELSPRNRDTFQDAAEPFIEDEEGRATLRIHLRRERSTKLILKFKASLPEIKCEACGFDFEELYGDLGIGFIEAHHKVPVSSLKDGVKTQIKELAALCSNCHRMIHRSGLIAVEELSDIIKKRRKTSFKNLR